MVILKCKMCGGNLNLVEGASTATCEYCGSIQTVPKGDDEKKITLFARANRLLIDCEFDKAAGIYEAIVADFPEEAEAYWGLVLCKYGIEYVDEPATGKKIPTCHRPSFKSIMDDDDFKQATENADAISRDIYCREAKQIDEICNRIIAITCSESPYDIFICYKDTDANGERTLDSVIAQDIYEELTDKGYRVFFSRISLEGKLGIDYEPYIFSALNSAAIMLVVGTKFEHFDAVWVKNEWKRFLQLMKTDRAKHLIPCYRDISPYDLPKEFRHLQGQDMSKIGATQDLLRGIKKCTPHPETGNTVVFEKNIHPDDPHDAQAKAPKKKRSIIKYLAFFAAIILCLGLLFNSMGNKYDTIPKDEISQTDIDYLKTTNLPFSQSGYILWGTYQQDTGTDTPKPIEWIPIKVYNNQVLLVSRYALDYTEREYDVPWSQSAVRQWLNEDFLHTAFTKEEQSKIVATTNDTPIITNFAGDQLQIKGYEDATTNKIFLLSADEVVSYMCNSPERYTSATAYAVQKGAYVGNNGNTWWGLRTTNPNFEGTEDSFGTTGGFAIRPAMWLSLE